MTPHQVFAKEWEGGRTPKVEDFLPSAETCATNGWDRTRILRELIATDLEIRWRSNTTPKLRVEEYLASIAKDTPLAISTDDTIKLLASEYLARRTAGDSASRNDIIQRFVHLRPALDIELDSVEQGLDQSTQAKNEQLLSTDGQSFATLSMSPIDSLPSNRVTAGSGRDENGKRIDRYITERLLGKGGFGSVYLANDTQLDRKVAIKLLHTDRFSTQQQASMFLAEASSTAKLNHPSIVTLHDIGKCDDGSYFVVMEYVDGQSMAQRLANHSLQLVESIEILVQVARALSYAHRRGFVHRDLKPANILIDTEGRCRVADFGLALHEDLQRMRVGEVAGTPAYMSPEQIRGESHLLDGRTDIWSLGVILYQVLTERLPFRGSTQAELFDDIQHRRPRPPRQLNKDVLPMLEHICLKCLASEVEARFRSAEDVAAGLQSALPLLEPVAETPVASRTALIVGGLTCLGAGGLMCFVGGFFVWVTWIALYGPFGAACNSSEEFQIGLVTFAILSSPLFVGLPLMMLGLWLCLVRGSNRRKSRYMSGKAVASLAAASMTPLLNFFACVPALWLARDALREIRQRYPRVEGRTFAYLGRILAISGTALSVWMIARAWVLSTAYQASDRGYVALQAGDIDNAVFEATLATNRFPEIAVAWKLRGEARLRRSEPKLAAIDLSRAISIYSPIISNLQQNNNSLVQIASCYDLRAQAYDQLGNAELALDDRKFAEHYRSFSTGKITPLF